MIKIAKNIIFVLIITALAILLTACDNGSPAETPSSSTPSEKCVHEWGEWTEEIAADCEKVGTQKRECKKCGESELEEIEALNHDFGGDEVSFAWSDDYSRATLTLGCTRCSDSDSYSIISSKSGTEADCENDGCLVYEVSIILSGVEYSDEKTVIPPKTGHSYTVSFEWSEDLSSAVLVGVCGNGEGHETRVEADVTLNVTKEASCNEVGSGEMTASAVLDGNEYSASEGCVLPVLPHNAEYSFRWSEDLTYAYFEVKCKNDNRSLYTSMQNAEITVIEPTCDIDGELLAIIELTYDGVTYHDDKSIVIPHTGHSYDQKDAYFFWSEDMTSAVLSADCTVCKERQIISENVRVTSVINEPTCQTEGVTVYTAIYEEGDILLSEEKTVYTDPLPHIYDFENAVWTRYGEGEDAIVVMNLRCSQGEGHVDEICGETIVINDVPNCEDDGSITYSTYVTINGKSYTHKEQIYLPANGHNYDIADVDWKGDVAEVKLMCITEITHIQRVTVPVTTEITEPGCTIDGEKRLRIEFTVGKQNLKLEKKIVIPAIGHDYHDRICLNCGRYKPSEGLLMELNSDGDGYIVKGRGECTDSIVVIPEIYKGLPVKKIYYSFSNDEIITELYISDSVKSVTESFRGCNNLSHIDFGYGLTDIYNSFTGLPLIKKIDLPESLTGIGNYSFNSCHSLHSVTLPKNLKILSETAFSDNYQLIEVYNLSSLKLKSDVYSKIMLENYAKNIYTPESGRSMIFEDKNGFLFYENRDDCYLLSYYGDSSELILPESCNGKSYGIYHYAFMGFGCSGNNLENVCVYVPDGVTFIGGYAFMNNNKIISVSGCRSVEWIDKGAFLNCDNLVSFTFGSKLRSVSESAFQRCISLLEVINLSSLKIAPPLLDVHPIIEYKDPSAESGLKIYESGYVTLSANGEVYLVKYIGDETKLTLPASLGGQYIIYTYAFDEDTLIEEINILGGVKEIKKYAFNIPTLTKLTLDPACGLEIIGDMAFSGNNIKSVYVPGTVRYLGANAFGKGIESVTFERTEGWRYSRFGGAAVKSEKISDPIKAAIYLKDIGDSNYYMFVETEE